MRAVVEADGGFVLSAGSGRALDDVAGIGAGKVAFAALEDLRCSFRAGVGGADLIGEIRSSV